MESVEAPVIHWVECSRCEKWRIIPPMPDGSEEEIPEIWFCEMNRDASHKTCEAAEEEYKAPEPLIMPLLPQMPPNASRFPRPAKSNDPESIRAKLKQLTNDDLQAAFESIDIERVLAEEFGDKLASARSKSFDPYVDPSPAVAVKSLKTTKTKPKEYHHATNVEEIRRIIEHAADVLPTEIKSQLTHSLHL